MARTESPTLVHELLTDAPFRERHSRVIDAPIDAVWAACTEVTIAEVRLISPLMQLRALPARVRTRHASPRVPAVDQTLLDAFSDEGFVVLRADAQPIGGEASLDFGAAGRFWSVTENQPVRFEGPDDVIDLARTRNRPDLALTVANLCAVDNGDDTTTVTTETRVDGTDAASRRAFGRYWFVIRLGSGAIRRSWLAAIERRARA